MICDYQAGSVCFVTVQRDVGQVDCPLGQLIDDLEEPVYIIDRSLARPVTDHPSKFSAEVLQLVLGAIGMDDAVALVVFHAGLPSAHAPRSGSLFPTDGKSMIFPPLSSATSSDSISRT